MIGYLKGKVLNNPANDGSVLVETNGVGYEVLVPSRVSEKCHTGDTLELFIHTHVREDALDLFGFTSQWDKKVFNTLTSVSGVGPKTAIGILSSIDAEHILSAIVRGDRTILNSLNGVGKKTAERLILELTEKAQKLLAEQNLSVQITKAGAKKNTKDIPAQGAVSAAGMMTEAASALIALGYKEFDAWNVLREVSAQDENADLQSLIKASLKKIGMKL